jgi:hypothetical protein
MPGGGERKRNGGFYLVIASVAKQSRAARVTLDCFATLAMTGLGSRPLPFALRLSKGYTSASE